MKLTKLERHMAYMIAITELEEYKQLFENNDTDGDEIARDGFCFLMFHLFDLRDCFDSFLDCLELFPEILDKKPKETCWLWWDANEEGGFDYRIAALKQCIEETADAWPK